MAALIKPVGAEAAALLAEMHAESFPANQAWGVSAITLMLGLPGHFGLLAIQQDQPLGFALGRVQADQAEILTIAVRPPARGQGVGRALLDALLAEAANRGAMDLFLEVAEPNVAARALYTGAGADEVGRRRRYYADGADALVLRLRVRE
ncbi:MAG: ribosomal-protein-alanine N-acetyltransferase [Alphaproteobacteria bacterium]|nr:ribosomal-protein-alanine N-acetyltransferase [Alphaproteobacteria bacterium]